MDGGFATRRDENTGVWGAPAAVRMEGGSIGAQIGAPRPTSLCSS